MVEHEGLTPLQQQAMAVWEAAKQNIAQALKLGSGQEWPDGMVVNANGHACSVGSGEFGHFEVIHPVTRRSVPVLFREGDTMRALASQLVSKPATFVRYQIRPGLRRAPEF
ncbi:MAG: hypothetical protein HY336_01970 [Candidatus Doudnabacteria bacterium]|nr:hypothetical protein [Candidatus Doudnabacteria bacterium]